MVKKVRINTNFGYLFTNNSRLENLKLPWFGPTTKGKTASVHQGSHAINHSLEVHHSLATNKYLVNLVIRLSSESLGPPLSEMSDSEPIFVLQLSLRTLGCTISTDPTWHPKDGVCRL